MNTISYKDLKRHFLDNDYALETAKKYFGKKQPSIYFTGFYSAPSWNWGYELGIVGVALDDVDKFFEVVTQFGEVVAAREIHLPYLKETD